MFETPTTLILGAGASEPYGYPLGTDLKNDIITSLELMLKHENGWVNELNFDDNLIAEFNAKFATSPRSSIDAFLSYQKEEFIPIGKTAIVDIISKSENKEKLEPKDDHWYRNFASKLLDCPFEDIGTNVGIISYNYDRSLETYLYYALISSFSECDNPSNCSSILKNIPIVHMYGRLDPLPWESNVVSRAYGENCDNNYLENLSKNINLIQEAEKKGTIDKANELLEKSTRVYFLGMDLYGNRANLDLLDTSLLRKKRIIATGFGLEKGEKKHVENYFNKIQNNSPRFIISQFKTLRSIRYHNPF